MIREDFKKYLQKQGFNDKEIMKAFNKSKKEFKEHGTFTIEVKTLDILRDEKTNE